MKAILSKEQDGEIARLYLSDLISSHQIAVTFGVSNATIIRSLRRSGVTMRKKTGIRHHDAWQRADELISDYVGGILTFDEIKKKYGASHLTIWRITDSRGIPRREHQVTSDVGRAVCRENGLKRNKYPVDSTFFDCIDSEEKAYWWGFLYADGYVDKNARAIVVNLSDADIDHMGKFRDVISPNRPIRVEVKFRKHLGVTTRTAVLRVDNKHISIRLQELGMMPKRTEFWRVRNSLPKHLFGHWLRGYFDGDGTASKNVDHPTIRILGQDDLLSWILDELNSIGVLHTSAAVYQKGGKDGTKINIYEFSVGGSRQMVLFRDWLYRDATVYLERKKEIMDTWEIKR